MQLYRQMGGVRDDLTIHEKALDVLIEFLKKEQVSVADERSTFLMTFCPFLSFQLDESVPLHGIDKAIGHFEVCILHFFVYQCTGMNC